MLCGIPFILAGTERTLASIIAFGEFTPGLVARIWLDLQLLFSHAGGSGGFGGGGARYS